MIPEPADDASAAATEATAPLGPEAREEAPERLQAVVRVVGSVVAPTTLLTALLFYFGWAHAYWFFRYFGVDISLLGLTTQDYVMRSVDALLVPLTVALTVGLLALWAHLRLTAGLAAGPEWRRRLGVVGNALGICGLALMLVGLARVIGLTRSFSLIYPLSLTAGTLLVLYASRLHRRRAGRGAPRVLASTALAEATAAFVLVGLSLFWAATNYAATVGETRARQFERELKTSPAAVVYSKEDLRLDAPGVRKTVCDEPEGGYRFRYEGLRLMLRSAGQYFFLPESWSPADGIAIVVPEGDTVRLQFTVSANARQRSPTGAQGC